LEFDQLLPENTIDGYLVCRLKLDRKVHQPAMAMPTKQIN
jgi:hypothetical protein